MKIKLFFNNDNLKVANTLKIQTPEGEISALYRDLVAVVLARWANTVSIVNPKGTRLIAIHRIPESEMDDIMKIIRLQGGTILEN